MPTADERRADHRERVLVAAEREFAQVGYADTKVVAIAEGAGLSLATVYKTFPGKEAIWDALHARRMEALVEQVDRRVAAAAVAGSPLERLLAGIGGVADYLVANDGYLELNLRASSGWLTTTGATGAQRTVWVAGLELIDSAVEATRAAGEIRGIRTRIATGMIVSALQVWLADWVDSGRDRAPDTVVTEMVDHLRLLLTSTTQDA